MRYFTRLNYGLGDEDTSTELALLPGGARHAVAIAGSGGRVIPLLARRPERLTCIDTNPLQLALTRCRFAALGAMEHDDYLAFLGYPPHPWSAQQRERAYRELPLDEKAAELLTPLWRRLGWGPIIYAGRFERMLQSLARVNRLVTRGGGTGIFACLTMDEQLRYLHDHFPRRAWRLVLFMLANSTVLNAIFYKGEFPKKNIPGLTRSIYEQIFDRLLTKHLARNNFFLQMVFFGALRYEEGNPVECDPRVYAAAKSAITTTKVCFELRDILDKAPADAPPFDFVSASDVPSFLPPQTAALYLQRLRSSLADGALVVTRGHLRVIRPVTAGFTELTADYRTLFEQEKTQLWFIQVHRRSS